MATETPIVGVPPEVSETIAKLNKDTENLQRELQQALEVWQTTLIEEKNRFDELLRHKELAWREQEEQWTQQTQAYETRLVGLKEEFESRLKLNEQQAAHALAELDDRWQRDKLEWARSGGADPALKQREKELEDKVAQLEFQLSEKDRAHTEQLQNREITFQQASVSLQERIDHSNELMNACLQALDHQITVLHDLIQP